MSEELEGIYPARISVRTLERMPEEIDQARMGIVFVPWLKPPRVGTRVMIDLAFGDAAPERWEATVVLSKPPRPGVIAGFRAHITRAPKRVISLIHQIAERAGERAFANQVEQTGRHPVRAPNEDFVIRERMSVYREATPAPTRRPLHIPAMPQPSAPAPPEPEPEPDRYTDESFDDDLLDRGGNATDHEQAPTEGTLHQSQEIELDMSGAGPELDLVGREAPEPYVRDPASLAAELAMEVAEEPVPTAAETDLDSTFAAIADEMSRPHAVERTPAPPAPAETTDSMFGDLSAEMNGEAPPPRPELNTESIFGDLNDEVGEPEVPPPAVAPPVRQPAPVAAPAPTTRLEADLFGDLNLEGDTGPQGYDTVPPGGPRTASAPVDPNAPVLIPFASGRSFLMHYNRFLEKGLVYVTSVLFRPEGTRFQVVLAVPDGEPPLVAEAISWKMVFPPEVPVPGWLATLDDANGTVADRLAQASFAVAES